MTDYYALLEVPRQATPEVIDKAYRSLALKYHPDLHPEHGDTMRQLNEAYAVLSNPDTRAQYDQRTSAPRRQKLPKPLLWFGAILLVLLLLRWILWFFLMTLVGNVLLALATTYALIRLRRSR